MEGSFKDLRSLIKKRLQQRDRNCVIGKLRRGLALAVAKSLSPILSCLMSSSGSARSLSAPESEEGNWRGGPTSTSSMTGFFLRSRNRLGLVSEAQPSFCCLLHRIARTPPPARSREVIRI